jgi:glucan phosphoethanolaminetransferase (alkaline phosphatase superfamily)
MPYLKNFKSFFKAVMVPMVSLFVFGIVIIIATNGFNLMYCLMFTIVWLFSIISSYFLMKWSIKITDSIQKNKRGNSK